MINLHTPPISSADWRQWRHRVGGSLLMTACADAVRSQIATYADIDDASSTRTQRVPQRELQYGELTARTLALARYLVRSAGSGAAHPTAFPAAPHRYPADDADFTADVDRRGATASVAAWISPIGLLPHATLPAVAGHARRVASAAGGDLVSQDVAAAQAVAVAVAARANARDPLDLDGVIATIAAHTDAPTLRAALQVVRALSHRGAPNVDVAGHLIDRTPVVAAFAAALHTFLTNADDPHAGLCAAVLAPHPDNSIATMAAAMIGARAGDDRVPQQWGSRLRSSLRVWTVAGELAELVNPAVDPG